MAPAVDASQPVDAEQERVTAALLAVAGHLEALTEERAQRARRASGSGMHRDRFDAEQAARDATAQVIIRRCRELARR